MKNFVIVAVSFWCFTFSVLANDVTFVGSDEIGLGRITCLSAII